jgi:hypothetical protein
LFNHAEQFVKIRFEVVLADLIAFNRYHCEHSPTVRRMRIGFIWGWSAMILLFPLAIAIPILVQGGPIEYLGFIAIGIVAAALWLILAPRLHRRTIDRRARLLYGEGENKAHLGIHELELAAEGLIERTARAQSVISWQAIERVVSGSDYTFIYVGALSASVIRHDAILEGDLNAFIGAIEQEINAPKGEPK